MTAEVQQQKPKTEVALGAPQKGFDAAYRLAANLAQSTLLPTQLRGKPSDVLVMMLYGQDLGLTPMQSIQGIYVVEGRPSLSAQLWRALARQAGHKVRVTARERGVSCTVTVTRKDEPDDPHEETYTIRDALRAGKIDSIAEDGTIRARSRQGNPLPWETQTDDMLTARATARGCRFACPEVALGFYTEDEIEHLTEDATPAEPPTLAEVADQRHIVDDAIDAEVVEDTAEDDALRDAVLAAQDEHLAGEASDAAEPDVDPDTGETVQYPSLDEAGGDPWS